MRWMTDQEREYYEFRYLVEWIDEEGKEVGQTKVALSKPMRELAVIEHDCEIEEHGAMGVDDHRTAADYIKEVEEMMGY